MRHRKTFYKCKNCLKEFSIIIGDKKCEYCGSNKIELIRFIQADNKDLAEIKKKILKNSNC